MPHERNMSRRRNISRKRNMLRKAQLLFCHNWIFYLTGCLVILGLKLFYNNASADGLKWMLTPIARWVSALSGISFTYVPLTGYVSHSHEFIIAPSCCGVQFLLIAIAATLFSYVHRMRAKRTGFVWTAFCIAGSWLYTVFINGIRIVISIYLPIWFRVRGLFTGWLTPERLHTMIGTVIYFSSLVLLYQIGGHLSGKLSGLWAKEEGAQDDPYASSSVTACGAHDTRVGFLIPTVWYFLIVLGIPFLGRAYRNDWTGFSEYASLVFGICLTISLLVSFFAFPRKAKRASKS